MREDQANIERARSEMAGIVGAEHIRLATPADAVDGLEPAAVIAPGSANEVAQVLRCCDSAGLAVIPRGGGTKLSLGNRPQRADFVLSSERMNRLVEHAWGDMTATVEAGSTIANLERALKEHGQQVAFDPMEPERATVGGVLASGESGTLRIRYGALRDLVLGLEMALPDGSVVKAGGKVVKNVAGYDLTKLAIGSLGTMGVITRAVFRLHPIPASIASHSASLRGTQKLSELVLAILGSNLVYTGLQIRTHAKGEFWVDIRFEGIPDSLDDQRLKLAQIAGEHAFQPADPEVWAARHKLFANPEAATISKASVLPAQLGSLCEAVFSLVAVFGTRATVVAQGTGLAEVRLDGGDGKSQRSLVNGLRREVERLRGTLIVEHCPATIKSDLDVWGPVGALPLMRRIKEQFDPARTLNPGRFVGGL